MLLKLKLLLGSIATTIVKVVIIISAINVNSKAFKGHFVMNFLSFLNHVNDQMRFLSTMLFV